MSGFTEGVPCWTEATIPDLESGKHFYGELFGWTFKGGEGSAHAYRHGKNVAALAQDPDGKKRLWTVYFASSDLATTVHRIRAAGGEIVRDLRSAGELGTRVAAQDPVGADFGILQGAGFELTGVPDSYCWAELYTRDREQVDSFYEAVFGFAARQVDDGVGSDLRLWSLGEVGVASRLRLGDDDPAELASRLLACFAVEDCDRAVTAIRRLGGRVSMGPQDSRFGRFAIVTDNQGAYFAVVDLTRKLAG